MEEDELRRVQNFVLSRRLADVNAPENLRFLAGLILDSQHLRDCLLTEPDDRKRREKFEAMRPYLTFKSLPYDRYGLTERASSGVQPFHEEQKALDEARPLMPPSFVHEVEE